MFFFNVSCIYFSSMNLLNLKPITMKRFFLKTIILLFLFSSNNIFAQQWLQLGQDIDGTVASERLGHTTSLSSDGSIVAIGTTDDNVVRVYKYNGTSWVQMGADITGSGNWGSAVSISGNGKILAIGAHNNSVVSSSRQGRIAMYEFDGTNWQLLGSYIDSDNGDFTAWYWGTSWGDILTVYDLGYSISLSYDGKTVAAGAYLDNTNQNGNVLVLEYNGVSWVRKGLVIEGLASNRNFGHSLSLSNDGNTIVIGDPNGVVGASTHGRIKVFQFNGTNWILKGSEILAATQERAIGQSVCISADGNTIAFGSNYNGGIGINQMDCGSAHVYSYSGGSWIAKGQALYGEQNSNKFGFSVSLSDDGSVLAVGESNYESGPLTPWAGEGQTKIYKYGGVLWTQIAASIIGEAYYDNAYAGGQSVSLSASGDTVAIGGFVNDGTALDAGHVRVFYLGAPLPIELLSFTGEHTNNANQLKWITISETNNDYFTLERSIDAENWETIAVLDGAGNSNQILEYAYNDYSFGNRINYYRLKQTDFDGTDVSFDIVSINTENTETYSAYYNYQQNNIQVFLPNIEEENNIQLIDYSGKLVYNATVKGTKKYIISENLTQGIYILFIYNRNGIQLKTKIFSK